MKCHVEVSYCLLAVLIHSNDMRNVALLQIALYEQFECSCGSEWKRDWHTCYKWLIMTKWVWLKKDKTFWGIKGFLSNLILWNITPFIFKILPCFGACTRICWTQAWGEELQLSHFGKGIPEMRYALGLVHPTSCYTEYVILSQPCTSVPRHLRQSLP